MNRFLGIAGILVLAGPALARPELSESRAREFAGKLSSEGLAGRLAEALKSDFGKRALSERLDLLQWTEVVRARQDGPTLYEEHLFTTDGLGRLVLRPERQGELDLVRRRIPLESARFETFSKRLDEIGSRILAEDDLDKAATALWPGRDWRLSLFNHYVAGGLPDSDLDVLQVYETRLRTYLVSGAEGKLHVSDPGEGRVAGLIREVYGLMDEAKKFEVPFQKLVSRGDPELAKAAARDGISLVAGARLSRDLRGDGADALSKLFDVDPKTVIRDAEEVLATAAALKPVLDGVSAALCAEDTRSLDLKGVLDDPRARLVLLLRLEPVGAEQKERLDRFFTDVLPAAWFDPKGDKLVWKKSLYRDWQGHDTIEGLRSRTYDNWKVGLHNLQVPFLSAAERCADSTVADLLRNVEALALLRQEVSRVTEAKAVEAGDRGAALFARVYFEEKDGRLLVRPEREKQVESILARAEELRREADAQKKN